MYQYEVTNSKSVLHRMSLIFGLFDLLDEDHFVRSKVSLAGNVVATQNLRHSRSHPVRWFSRSTVRRCDSVHPRNLHCIAIASDFFLFLCDQ